MVVEFRRQPVPLFSPSTPLPFGFIASSDPEYKFGERVDSRVEIAFVVTVENL